MASAGDIVLFRFPQTDTLEGKLRPALLVTAIPSKYDDWLVCLISTQFHQILEDLDDTIDISDADFASSGLKAKSLIRITRLAVVSESILLGSTGSIAKPRLERVRRNISNWILKG
ncbi:MAG: type II toxin-antitoxin system PemK/MazF family toxin [Acidobacteria bacterium]|nr:type II toxin-antitoxin system PemK/MazF family toxin [Acidobacteriota bacterium]